MCHRLAHSQERIGEQARTIDQPSIAANGHDPDPQPIEVNDPVGGVTVSFTKYEARGMRLSKLYELGADGKVIKSGGTQLSNGRYETVSIEAADPQAALAEIGARIDALNFREAIGLGVVCDGIPLSGDITTKAKYEKRKAGNRTTAIPRALSHFGWPSNGCGLLLFDGDETDGLRSILVELFPDFADVAVLTRPSASASLKDPKHRRAAEDRRTSLRAARRAGEIEGMPDGDPAAGVVRWHRALCGLACAGKRRRPPCLRAVRRHRRLARAPDLRGRDLDRQRS